MLLTAITSDGKKVVKSSILPAGITIYSIIAILKFKPIMFPFEAYIINQSTFEGGRQQCISLLNSDDKLFEILFFKHMFNHFQDSHLLSAFQSGFIPGDSCINQLTLLYNLFGKAIDAGREVRVVFCDISKAFDQV